MVTTNQKPTTNKQKLDRKKHKHTTKENPQNIREEAKRRIKTEKNYKSKQKTNNKMSVNTYLLVITLNINELNGPVKRHMVADWMKKQDLTICCLQEVHSRAKETHRVKLENDRAHARESREPDQHLTNHQTKSTSCQGQLTTC